MRTCTRFLISLGFLAASAAQSMAADTCGGDIAASAVVSGVYDPFSPTGITETVTLTVQRNVGGGGAKTQNLSFYLIPVPPPDVPSGTQILYSGVNFLGTTLAEGPAMTNNTFPAGSIQAVNASPHGWIGIGFGGAAQPHQHSFPATFVLGPNWNILSGESVFFDMVYVCRGTGGFDNVTVPTTHPTSVEVSIEVRSGLRARYAGPPLDFGEIGDIDNTGASAHFVSGLFNVESTGPYEVQLTSEKNFRMSYLPAPVGSGMDSVAYQIEFLGDTLQSDAPTLVRTCQSAGIVGGDNLPITATLVEGGMGKTPSPDYEDVLTVTITPLAAGVGAPGTCS